MRFKLFEGSPETVEADFNGWQRLHKPYMVMGTEIVRSGEDIAIMSRWSEPDPSKAWARTFLHFIEGLPHEVEIAINAWLQTLPTDMGALVRVDRIEAPEGMLRYLCTMQKVEQPKIIAARNGDQIVH